MSYKEVLLSNDGGSIIPDSNSSRTSKELKFLVVRLELRPLFNLRRLR